MENACIVLCGLGEVFRVAFAKTEQSGKHFDHSWQKEGGSAEFQTEDEGAAQYISDGIPYSRLEGKTAPICWKYIYTPSD